ncbi:MAG TPA: TraB/GumN family protein, partial [Puia sp.]|nr:TraB/GumN family protein [Puia sp.]
MRSTPFWRCVPATVFLLLLALSLPAQRHIEKKYPALLWEITGNGLKKPSYLFGTMHVSSKLVFHLSDSFYLDIKNADVVALELDPQLWQDQLFRFEKLQSNLRYFTQGAPNDFINEKTFQLRPYEDRLRAAISDEPTVINGLLYRTFRSQADFEEDTYLDLYIYQTGRKLGKQATGVENYFQTERLIMEAAQDMMKDKRKKAPDTDGESIYEIERKTQEAYRKGDLDMLDSLERLMEPSESYMEKFLYRRNEIQAASIDSIVRRHSLFVGVGAAHLPGKRGVIELLRRKGYTLRPVMMPDQDATRRDDIDKIRVPVTFSSFTAPDGAFSVQLPGKLYRRTDARSPDSWQYADMSNGAYYMIGKVKTNASFLGQREETVLKKVDSLLYENVPGKILKRTAITRNGYEGYDVTARTRRGDIQRYNILVSSNEIWVFKMSGNNNYVDGPEAEQFFGSIRLHPAAASAWVDFTPARGGFTIRLPQLPAQSRSLPDPEGVTRWDYEATDSATGDGYLLWKATVQNYRFMEEDTADLALVEESFRSSDWIDKCLVRRQGTFEGHACLDASYEGKDGSFIRARYILHGPDYYVLAAHSKSKDQSFSTFFNSLTFVPYRYPSFRNYVDSFMHISVTTPVVPDVDAGIRGIIERASSEEFLNSLPDYNNYWPHPKTALFQDDSTGEAVFVSVQTFPKYYYPRDTASFWQEEAGEKRLRRDLVVGKKQPYRDGALSGYRYTLTDTNTTRRINIWVFLQGDRLFRVVSLCDSLQQNSPFLDRFYASFRPDDRASKPSVFDSKLDIFFRDFYSPDSAIAKKAKQAIPNVYFGPAGVPLLLKAIRTLPYNGTDYFETKTRLINELGYFRDSSATPAVVAGLHDIYRRA